MGLPAILFAEQEVAPDDPDLFMDVKEGRREVPAYLVLRFSESLAQRLQLGDLTLFFFQILLQIPQGGHHAILLAVGLLLVFTPSPNGTRRASQPSHCIADT
ncbi:SH3 domain-containing protein [Apiospora arundinis]